MPDDINAPKYVNIVKIVSDPQQFFVDHIIAYPAQAPPDTVGPWHGQAVCRLVMSPSHAKEMLQALGDNIRTYEEKHGEIDPVPTPPPDSMLN
jgi:hypothetical protein